jgi:aminoglycoside phosphotransferase (APT) family kinase protein
MPGKTLRKALESGSRRLPTGPDLVALLDSLPNPPVAASHVPGPVSRATGHARLLKAVTPELADRIDAVLDAFRAVDDEATTAVHGDFHASQVLAKGTSVVGLIDVDTAGLGARSDDLAGLIGHLSTLSLASSARRKIEGYGAAIIADLDRITEPASLRLRTAAVILGLATGPFRVQQPHWPVETERRITLAERWLESARALSP